MSRANSVGTAVAGLLLVLVTTPVGGEERSLAAGSKEALTFDTVGARDSPPPPRTVTPPGSYALSIEGDFRLGGFVFKDGAPFLHNDGGEYNGNTALGVNALVSLSTPEGSPDAASAFS